MQSILIANPKGGSGKSTLSTNLAGYLARQGAKVMLGDVDRQQSSRLWLRLRPADMPPIATWQIEAGEPARPPKGTTHAILDTPAGLHGKKLAAVLKQVDRVLVPIQASPFDLAASGDFLRLVAEEKAVRKGRLQVGLVGNRVDPRTRYAQELQTFVQHHAFPLLTCLRDSQVYVQAAAAGLSLFDLPKPKVSKDLAQWQAILDWLAAAVSS